MDLVAAPSGTDCHRDTDDNGDRDSNRDSICIGVTEPHRVTVTVRVANDRSSGYHSTAGAHTRQLPEW